MTSELIATVIAHLQPEQFEYMESDSQFEYWMSYACVLDDLSVFCDDPDTLVTKVNNLLQKRSASPEHHAACDIASTLESMDKSFVGKFKY